MPQQFSSARSKYLSSSRKIPRTALLAGLVAAALLLGSVAASGGAPDPTPVSAPSTSGESLPTSAPSDPVTSDSPTPTEPTLPTLTTPTTPEGPTVAPSPTPTSAPAETTTSDSTAPGSTTTDGSPDPSTDTDPSSSPAAMPTGTSSAPSSSKAPGKRTVTPTVVGTGTISGTVTASGAAALPNITVTAYVYDSASDSWNWAADTQTGDSGAELGVFSLTDLDPGRYRVGYQDNTSEYAPEYFDNQLTLDSATDLTIPPAGASVTANAELAVASTVAGTVTDSSAAPVDDVAVALYRWDPSESSWQSINSAISGQDAGGQPGHYTVAGLAAGTYRIGFTDQNGLLAPEFYNNALTVDAGTDVIVPAAGTVTVNASLVTGGTISGAVTDVDGAVSGESVSIYRQNGADWNYVTNALTSADSGQEGEYSVAGLAAGTYRIQFSDPSGAHLDQWYDGAATLQDATDVTIAAGGTATADALLSTSATISGVVTKDGTTTKIAGIAVSAQTQDNNGDWNQVAGDTTNASGAYQLTGLTSGSYVIEFQDPQHRYTDEYNLNRETADTADAVTVSSGGTTTVNAGLATGGSLAGTIKNAAGTGLAGISVSVTRHVGDDWDNIGTVTTAANGTYTFGGLRSGTYFIQAQDGTNLYAAQYYPSAYLFDDRTELDVTSGHITSANMTLGKAGTISGTILGSGNNQLATASVGAYRLSTGGQWQFLASASTGDDSAAPGHYSIAGIPAGQYKISISDSSGGYFAEYYNDVASIDDATPVTVAAAGSATVSAQLAPAAKINGEVRSTGGQLLDDIEVDLYKWNPDGTSWDYVDNSYSGWAGTGLFTIGSLQPGSYQVVVQDASGNYVEHGLNADLTPSDAGVVTLAPLEHRALSIQLVPAAHITGTLTGMGGVGLGNVWATAEQWDAVNQYWRSVGDSGRTSTAAATLGQYNIGGLPAGSYKVSYSPATNEYRSSYYGPGEADETTGATVTVGAGATVSGINQRLFRNAVVTGKVTSSTGVPLAGVKVQSRQSSWDSGSTQVTTDAAGNYTLPGLDAGTYTVGFTGKSGYSDAFLAAGGNSVLSYQLSTKFVVAAPLGADAPTYTGKNGKLVATGKISGTVKNAAGKPVSGVSVTASGDGGWSTATTNAAGGYTIADVVPDAYQVQFDPATTAYASQYFSGATTMDSAAPVVVGSGKTVTANATLAAGSTIKGTVKNAAGATVPGVMVSVLTVANGSTNTVSSGVTAANGVYSFGGLPSGSYTVFYEAPDSTVYAKEYWDNKRSEKTATRISLAAGATSTLNPVLDRSASISGRVTLAAGGASSDPDYISVIVSSADGAGWTSQGYVGGGDLSYSVGELPPGSYTVQFVPQDSASAVAIGEYWDNRSTAATATKFVLSAGQVKTGVNAELARSSTITGLVKDAAGQPVADSYVQAKSADGKIDLLAKTGADGSYQVGGLSAGSYSVTFDRASGGSKSVYAQQYWNNSYGTPTPLAVGAAAVVPNVNATLATGGTISGTVTGPGGIAMPNVSVHAFTTPAGLSDRWGYTGADGSYSVTGLGAGNHTITFTDYTYGRQTVTRTGLVALTLGGAVTGINGVITDVVPPSPPDPVPTRTWLHLNRTSTPYGTSATAAITVSGLGTVPSGTVTVKDGATTIGTGALSATTGTVTVTLPKTLAVGGHHLTVVYPGRGPAGASNSPEQLFTVTKAVTAAKVTLSKTTVAYGSTTVSASIAVTAPGVTPSGSVTLKDGSTTIKTVSLSGGKATVALSKTLAVKVHSLTATYAGGSSYNTATSPAVKLTVNKAVPTVSVKLAAAKIHKSAKGKITVTIKVTGVVPTGSVTIKDGTRSLSKTTLPASKKGVLVITLPALGVGTHRLTAAYSGSPTVAAKTSASITLTVIA